MTMWLHGVCWNHLATEGHLTLVSLKHVVVLKTKVKQLSKYLIVVANSHPHLCSASLGVVWGYFTIIYPLNIFHRHVFIVYDRACNIFK